MQTTKNFGVSIILKTVEGKQNVFAWWGSLGDSTACGEADELMPMSWCRWVDAQQRSPWAEELKTSWDEAHLRWSPRDAITLFWWQWWQWRQSKRAGWAGSTTQTNLLMRTFFQWTWIANLLQSKTPTPSHWVGVWENKKGHLLHTVNCYRFERLFNQLSSDHQPLILWTYCKMRKCRLYGWSS